MSQELQTISENIPMVMTAKQVMSQVQLIQEVMQDAMKDGEHYGVIPGCGTKPALLKAGAEKLSLTFRLSPSYKIERLDLPNGHREYVIICELRHIETSKLLGAGVGSCSTMESKYRWRNAARKCPECGKEAIIKGKAEFGGGWLCFARKGGCGAKWRDGDAAIEAQDNGKIENQDIADQYNTVLKMAKKRAQVDATLTALAASDIFTQDIEERLDGDLPLKNEPTTQDATQDIDYTAIVRKEVGEICSLQELKDYQFALKEKGMPWWTKNAVSVIAERKKEIESEIEVREMEIAAAERSK